MSAAVDLCCWLCGGHGDLETAATKYGPEYVCEDGYACASRANAQRAGKTWFAVVTTPPVAQPHETVGEIK